MGDSDQVVQSQHDRGGPELGNSEPLLSSIIIKTVGYSVGFALALFVGLLHGDLSCRVLQIDFGVVCFMLSLWASSLPFFYFYCLLFNTGEGGQLKSIVRKNHLTVSGLCSALAMLLFLVLARSLWPLSALPIICFFVYFFFAVSLSKLSDSMETRPVRFKLVVPVLAATALPFCLGTYLSKGRPSAIVSLSFLVIYIVVVLAGGINFNKRRFVSVSLTLVAVVVCGTLLKSWVPLIVSETSSVLFMSILIAAVSGVFESWRITDCEAAEQNDYFLSSSLALLVSVLLFPMIFLAGGFSNIAYYTVPVFLLVCMTIWCISFERWHGKWKLVKTFIGFLYLFVLVCDSLVAGSLAPADTTLFYNPQSMEALAMSMALFGLYGAQVTGAIDRAKVEHPLSVVDAGRSFFQYRTNYFRFIGYVSSMLFSVMYVVQNLLGIRDIGAVGVSDLMGSYMYLALICAVFDFVLVFFVSEKTLRGGR